MFTLPRPRESRLLTVINKPIREVVFEAGKELSGKRKSFRGKRARNKGHRKAVRPKN
jgi:hypothetical protein